MLLYITYDQISFPAFTCQFVSYVDTCIFLYVLHYLIIIIINKVSFMFTYFIVVSFPH